MRRIWLRSVSAYTLGGTIAAGLVGASAGWVGTGLRGLIDPRWLLVVAAATGAWVILREGRFRSWPMPQLRRQTPEDLRVRYGAPVAAGLWGFDLGLVFSTWLTFAGPWFLLAVTIAIGDPVAGMALFIAHWLARAAWLWLSAWLLPSARVGPAFSRQVSGQIGLFRSVQVVATATGVAAVLSLVSQTF